MKQVVVIGSGQTRFGELWRDSIESLAICAGTEALQEAQIMPEQVDAVFVGNMLLPILERRAHVGRIVADALGLSCPAFHTEAACASGGMAVHMGRLALLSGQFTTVLVLGVEKMTDAPTDVISSALMGAGSENEQLQGATFPALYGLITRSYQQQYAISDDDMAAQAVHAHFHARLNPLAQFKTSITAADVHSSPVIADPIRLLHASPISDGAAALVLTTKPLSKTAKVTIIGSGLGSDVLDLSHRKTITSFASTKQALSQALLQAKTTISAIDMVELHDCFSVAQAIAIEDLGICKPGSGAQWIAHGNGRLTGKGIIINPSGGLKGCGHPVGATGVKQVVELYRQIRTCRKDCHGKCIRQGLTHNIGGTGATAVITILRSA
jgi:acetyl-CoA C-acetyltransferase